MNLIKLGLSALVVGALSACPGGNNNNNNDAVCGNGTQETGEQCDDGNTAGGDGCSATCTEEGNFDLECPRLVDLTKVCVPLPNSGEVLTDVGPNDACGAGFFPEVAGNSEAFQVRRLFSDTILIKETNGVTGERPVMALFLGEGKALLYDSGDQTGAVADVIAPFLQGRTVELLNTHLHGDHINNNPDFDVIAIETNAVDDHCQINADSFDANQAAACDNPVSAIYTPPSGQELFNLQSFKVIRVVRNGHKIDLGNGRVLEVLATPGHSVTSITLHDPFHRLLFTGDSLYPNTEGIFDNNGNDFGIPLVHPNGSNGADYLETAQKYAALEADIDVVIGAHSQGVMPSRTLGQFLTAVQNQQDQTDATCDSGSFSFDNFP
jgi:cysteine-rich repeat protein